MAVRHNVTDASYFSPTANVKTPQLRIPPCDVCGKPSLGGVMDKMEPVAPVGHPTFDAIFYCADHNPGTFALMSDRLFPVYRIMSMESPSRMKVQRLDRAQQEARVR